MKPILTTAILLVLAIYLGDYLSAKYQIPSGRQTRDTVEVQRDVAIKQKDRKFEFMDSVTVEEECVLSLFPHFRDKPCWYLRRHTQEHIVLDTVTPGPLFDR